MSIDDDQMVERVLRVAVNRGRRLRRAHRTISLSVVCSLVLVTSAVVALVSQSGSPSGGPAGGVSAPILFAYGPNGTEITPIDTATDVAEPPITLAEPSGDIGHLIGMTAAPGGKTVWVANGTGNGTTGTVTAIDVATEGVSRAITLPGVPAALALSPNGRFVYVAVTAAVGGAEVVVISAASRAVTATVNVPDTSAAVENPLGSTLVVTPDGSKLYMAVQLTASQGGTHEGAVIPVDLHTLNALPAVNLGEPGLPVDLALAMHGQLLIVTTDSLVHSSAPAASHLIAIVVPTNRRILSRLLGSALGTMTIAPDGLTVYDPTRSALAVQDLVPSTKGRSGVVQFPGETVLSLVPSPDGRRGLAVVQGQGGTCRLYGISLRQGWPVLGSPLVNGIAGSSAIFFSPGGERAYVADANSSTVIPIDMATQRPRRPIRVGPGGTFLVLAV